MSPGQRIFDPLGAIEDPATPCITIAQIAAMLISLLIIAALGALGWVKPDHRRELMRRYRTWAFLVPLLVVPILLGAATAMALVCVLSLLCYREYARATGLFHNRLLSALVVLGIFCITFAVGDNYYRLFVALGPMVITVIAAAALLADHPKGYIQRVALASFGFVMCGLWLGHLGFLGNDANYRAIMLWILVSLGVNDIAAYIAGKSLGQRKLCPKTSPSKTVSGAVGALIVTTVFAAGLGHYVFRGQPIDTPAHLIALGLIISITGQVGDLMLSSIKRDLAIKDMAATLPGHGGLLDRFDSLLLAAPSVFHFINYFQGVANGSAANIITGSFGRG